MREDQHTHVMKRGIRGKGEKKNQNQSEGGAKRAEKKSERERRRTSKTKSGEEKRGLFFFFSFPVSGRPWVTRVIRCGFHKSKVQGVFISYF